MQNTLKILWCIAITIAFVYLASLKPVEHGYTMTQIEAVNEMVKPSKKAIMMDLWNVKESDLTKPVVLWKD